MRSPFSKFFISLCLTTLSCNAFAQSGAKAPASKTGKVAKTAAAGPLGDLTPFNAIAKETLKIVEKGDLIAAKERIRDLEKAWDDTEEKMRPMSDKDWTTADDAIDRALAKLRGPNPKRDACGVALNDLVATLDKLQKQK